MPFVLDASMAASWAFTDEESSASARVLAECATSHPIVPTLFWFEIRNILVVNERRQRITAPVTETFLRNLSLLSLQIDSSPDETVLLRLARLHNLTVYDAAYLELACREALSFATLDKQLADAATSEGLTLL
jgi:predicted nucleic acid-binding protein